ncbi:MAG: response regulator transcription factor [Thermoflexaceae bacterium]|nr:response regulator transcription factor [Thermoflexaceae bacterium]
MSRILIIEDEEAIAELEKDYLEVNGYEAVIENQGDTGLIRVLKEDFDLVILDVMLPGMDGFQVCSEIRNVKDIPIIMVSAKKEDIDKIRGLGFGADDYMTKPFSPGELVARVKAHLARYERLVGGGNTKNRIIEIHGLKIDQDARKVFVNGEEKQLTAREYDMLLYFVQNPNKAIPKKELFSAVWGLESFGDISTVTVHINKLRDKIEYDSSNPQYIETVWGVGYRFKM